MKKILILILLTLLLVGCQNKSLEQKLEGNWIMIEQSTIIHIDSDSSEVETISFEKTYDPETKVFESKQRSDDEEFQTIDSGEGDTYTTNYSFSADMLIINNTYDNYLNICDIDYTSKNSFTYKVNQEETESEVSALELYGIPMVVKSIDSNTLVVTISLDHDYIKAAGDEEFLTGFESTTTLKKVD